MLRHLMEVVRSHLNPQRHLILPASLTTQLDSSTVDEDNTRKTLQGSARRRETAGRRKPSGNASGGASAATAAESEEQSLPVSAEDAAEEAAARGDLSPPPPPVVQSVRAPGPATVAAPEATFHFYQH